MSELHDQEKANKFIDAVGDQIKELDMPIEQVCALLLLIADKFWTAHRKPPFIEFMRNCDQYLRERDFD